MTSGQCGSQGAPGREMLSESKLRDLLPEYVLTYMRIKMVTGCL
jgi:auxin-responsive protein IAA